MHVGNAITKACSARLQPCDTEAATNHGRYQLITAQAPQACAYVFPGAGLWGSGESGGTAFVPVVQAANFGDRNDATVIAPLYRPGQGCVFRQGQVRACPMVIGDKPSYMSVQAVRTKDEYVIQAFPPDGSDHPFHVRPLPWSPRRRQHLLYS